MKDHSTVTMMEPLEFFTNFQTSTTSYKEQCSENLKKLEAISNTIGLQPNEITHLVEIIGERKFPDYLSRTLIRLLIPANKIDTNSVINIISWICTRTLSLSVQKELLKWVVTFYDFVDNRKDIHALYGVIFSFLASDALRPMICCLLHLITLEEDVLPSRAQYLISLQKRVGAHPYLTSLLKMYHSYKPNMLVLKHKTQKEKIVTSFPLVTNTFQKQYRRARSIQGEIPVGPFLRKDLVLDIFDIKSYSTLERTLCMVELPDAIKMVLKSPLRRFYLTSCKESLLIQLQFWLFGSVYDEIMSCHKSKLKELLEVVIAMSEEFQKEQFTDILPFLRSSVALQNDFFPLSLRLLEHLPFSKTDEALYNIQEMFCCSPVENKCSIIRSLTKLYLNWHLLESHCHKWKLKVQEEPNALDLEILTTFRKGPSTEFQPEDAILQLTNYINKLITFALFIHPDCHPVILHSAFLFYNMVLDVCEQQQSRFISHPPKTVVYCSLFSCNSFLLTRVCHLMTRYKNVITILKSRGDVQHLTDVISTINGYVVDISDALWLCKTFSSKKASIFCVQDIPLPVISSVSSIGDHFSLYHHPALIWLVREFVFATEGSTFDLAESLLSDLHMRNAFIEVLTEKNVDGIASFVNTFIHQKSH